MPSRIAFCYTSKAVSTLLRLLRTDKYGLFTRKLKRFLQESPGLCTALQQNIIHSLTESTPVTEQITPLELIKETAVDVSRIFHNNNAISVS